MYGFGDLYLGQGQHANIALPHFGNEIGVYDTQFQKETFAQTVQNLSRCLIRVYTVEQMPQNVASDQGLHCLQKTNWYFSLKCNKNDTNKINQIPLI